MIKSIYIHIPFCEKKCNYCAFCSYNLIKAKETYLKALKKEIKFLYKNELLDTIYFGGGTPSLLEPKEIEDILRNLNYDSKTQITLEANPHTITNEKIKSYKNLGINRISLGVQSFNNKQLQLLGRTHDKKEIYNSIEILTKNDIENYSIDLMYGIPEQNLNHWEETLDIALKLNPAHISLYGLKIEEGTYFYKFPPKKIASQDEQAKMYELATKKLEKNYRHYEFSNFAKNESLYSLHNLVYWQNKEYYGVGLSASGYINSKRYTNTFNYSKYIKNPQDKNYEALSLQNKLEEEIFLGLRLIDGIDFEKINLKYNINIEKKYGNIFQKYLKDNFFEKTEKGIKLSLKGILISNEILCEFIDM